MKRSEILRQAMEDAVITEALVDIFENMENDVVISWNSNRTGRNAMPQYTFVAVKCAGYWYTTVLAQQYRLTSAQLLDTSWFKARTTDVWIVTQWGVLLEDD
jgi:hypothetical protein